MTRPKPIKAVLTAALLGALIGLGAAAPAHAEATPTAGVESADVHPLAIAGPFSTYADCKMNRDLIEYLYGWETTPCFRDPAGWFHQYFPD